MVSSVAACCLRTSYGARPTMHCQWDDSSIFFVFFVPGDLDLWPLTLTFELGRDFCTMCHLTAELSCWQTNWQTNKPTPLKTSTTLRYATPVGNKTTKEKCWPGAWSSADLSERVRCRWTAAQSRRPAVSSRRRTGRRRASGRRLPARRHWLASRPRSETAGCRLSAPSSPPSAWTSGQTTVRRRSRSSSLERRRGLRPTTCRRWFSSPAAPRPRPCDTVTRRLNTASSTLERRVNVVSLDVDKCKNFQAGKRLIWQNFVEVLTPFDPTRRRLHKSCPDPTWFAGQPDPWTTPNHDRQSHDLHTRLVGWLEFNVLFQHIYGDIRDDFTLGIATSNWHFARSTQWLN